MIIGIENLTVKDMIRLLEAQPGSMSLGMEEQGSIVKIDEIIEQEYDGEKVLVIR